MGPPVKAYIAKTAYQPKNAFGFLGQKMLGLEAIANIDANFPWIFDNRLLSLSSWASSPVKGQKMAGAVRIDPHQKLSVPSIECR